MRLELAAAIHRPHAGVKAERGISAKPKSRDRTKIKTGKLGGRTKARYSVGTK